MYIVFLLIPVIIITAVFLINFFNKRILVVEVKKLQNKTFRLLAATKSFSENNAYILQNEYGEIKSFLLELENILKNLPGNIELQRLIDENQQFFIELNKKIEEKKQQWSIFADFKNDVEFIKINLKTKINEINKKGQLLIVKEEKYKDVIDEKIEETVSLIKSLIKEYEALERATFNEFNFYILEDLQKEYTDLLEKIDQTFKEFNYFTKEIKLKIISINRKSSFYITLEEQIGRKKIRQGEIVVSYKTFKDAYEGKKYRKDTYFGGKRIANNQNIQLEISIDENIHRFTLELDNEEFEDIYLQLPIEKNSLIKDDNNLPLELNLINLDILVCEKEKNSFEIKFHLKHFAEKGINDFLKEYEQFNTLTTP